MTALLTNVISNNASVVLMVPVAVEAARDPAVAADPFSFIMAVTFAASTAFMTPMGYQTNLMVYSPGGYRFTDYVRVGAPLQLLFAVATTLGIAAAARMYREIMNEVRAAGYDNLRRRNYVGLPRKLRLVVHDAYDRRKAQLVSDEEPSFAPLRSVRPEVAR